MKNWVAMIAMRRSHKDEERARRRSGARDRVNNHAPTMWGAELSTRSQLLMNFVLARYRR
jgi:hypothetical protein